MEKVIKCKNIHPLQECTAARVWEKKRNVNRKTTGLHSYFPAAEHKLLDSTHISLQLIRFLLKSMARRSFTLAPLKLTRRSACGSVKREDLHQGAKVVEVPISVYSGDHSDDHPTPMSSPSATTPISSALVDEVEETMYSIEAKSSVAGWEAVRERLLFGVTESLGMPVGQMCVLCRKSDAVIRCQQCGPLSYYCRACTDTVHSQCSFLHTTEQWTVCLHDLSCVLLKFTLEFVVSLEKKLNPLIIDTMCALCKVLSLNRGVRSRIPCFPMLCKKKHL